MTNYPSTFRSEVGYAAVMDMYEAALTRGPVRYETTVVSTRYRQTHIVIGGPAHGQPVIIFHGWNGNAASAGADFPFLFNSFRVFVPDIIGHSGKSAPTRPNLTGSTYADWASDVLDALNIPQAVVVGISGGGWMALKLAAYHPHRVARAIAISTDGLSPTNRWGMVWGMLPVALFPNRVTAEWFLKFCTASNTPSGEQARGFAEAMEILIRHFKTQGNPGQLPDDELRQITSPLLVLMGQAERIFKPQVAVEQARRLIPGLVSAEIVPEAGHLMTIDQPGWLQQRVLRFMQEGV